MKNNWQARTKGQSLRNSRGIGRNQNRRDKNGHDHNGHDQTRHGGNGCDHGGNGCTQNAPCNQL